MTHKQILSFLKVLRHSFHDASIVYRYGGCYGLYQILKEIEPKAKALFPDEEKDHIITRIGTKYYHIDGEYRIKPEDMKYVSALTENDHEYWEGVADGQRLEYILAKYQRAVNRTLKND